MQYWIDTHAHIYLDEFDQDRPAILSKCIDNGVRRIYMPNIDHTSIEAMLETENKFPEMCFATMGLHPCSVKSDFQKELYIVEEWLAKRTFAAIGEIGTDLYWDKTFWDQQQEAFTIQANWAKQYGRPVIIHCRESLDQTIALIEKLSDRKLTGIFHCFGGTLEQAKRIIDVGFYLGIGGVVTFKKSGLDLVLPHLDLSRIVLETDSPYLAPVPYRGKRNEPTYIPLIAQRLAGLMNEDLEKVQEITTANALRLFDDGTV